ncbi:GNAT family N-acetyltransferase [Pseudophaeobacter flagellatus]|uniref:GNAT family N-acetyltransferase n=1 Tax=Pseudophaeobacter flagellatus TaxID=2899119 RepID=UPI001E42E224|nr:GNAT family N-acetyltransferase [Pseudophaeobacter flagellatus]MCD9149372.1 GNAT family N-acetyltransferase [Pseudophaeobacter flagellatus]
MTVLPLPIPVIETERLILRAPQPGDLKAMVAFFETTRSHMVGGPRDAMGSYTSLVSRLGHWVLNGYGLWHIVEKASGAFIGWTGMIFAPTWSEPELGWTLFEGAEGKGHAFEAATAARVYAARHQGLNGVISYIAPSNSRSMALATRLGASFERDTELLGKPCQIWRHPKMEVAA